MVKKFKTLVVFDTNRLRTGTDSALDYGSFDLSSDFKTIRYYVDKKKLVDFVDIGIPSIVIKELLKQKQEQYEEDMQKFLQLQKRLDKLPETNFQNITTPPDGFDCRKTLEKYVSDFLTTNKIKTIDLDSKLFSDVFQNIVDRSIEKSPPFKQTKNASDIGFKDVVIWESLLNYSELNAYQKIILLTNDGGFNPQCETEFTSKIKIQFNISRSSDEVIREFEKDYVSIFKMNEFSDFVASDYFTDHLKKEISRLTTIQIKNETVKIKQTDIQNYFESLEEDTIYGYTVIVSSLKCIIEQNHIEKNVFVLAKTYLDDTKGLQYTEFEFGGNIGE